MATGLNQRCRDQNSKTQGGSTTGVRWAHRSKCGEERQDSCPEIPIRTGRHWPCGRLAYVRKRGDGRRTCRPPGGRRRPLFERAGKPTTRRGRGARQWSEWPGIGWLCACLLIGAQEPIITDFGRRGTIPGGTAGFRQSRLGCKGPPTHRLAVPPLPKGEGCDF